MKNIICKIFLNEAIKDELFFIQDVPVYIKREDNQDMVTITKAYVHKQQSSECQQGDNYM